MIIFHFYQSFCQLVISLIVVSENVNLCPDLGLEDDVDWTRNDNLLHNSDDDDDDKDDD